MAAAGVRPKATRVVLRRVPLLEQDPSLGVDEKDREGPVQESFAMGGYLLSPSERTVVLVDQNELICIR